MILDAWGWCTGTTQRDGMRREEGGGFRMGNTCIPVADSCCIWQNQYNIVKLKNKIKKFFLIFLKVKKKKIAGRNINNLRYADNTTLMAESEEFKSLLMKVKEER